MYQLRDKTTVADQRLDRLKEFDERSRNFRIAAVKKPRSYSWRCSDYLDQGSDGACVGFAVAHELIARPSEVYGVNADYAKKAVYWEAQKIDPWDGGSYPGATPKYEGTSVLAGVKVAHKLGWFDEYRWGFGLEDLVLGVGHNGPAVLGIPWYEGMMNTDPMGHVSPTGRVVGGHAILCKAVDVKRKEFILHNSWGRNWGFLGDCFISFMDMTKLLHEDGEVVFFIKRHHKII